MQVTQLKDLVNNAVKETVGTSELLKEDLSNVVDVGQSIIGSDNVDNYVKKLIDRIGKTVFNTKVYKGSVPSVLMSSWDFGSILEKIDVETPEAQENDSWNLVDGKSYDQDVFYQPKVSAKFFNSKTTFSIPMSFTKRQVMESFNSASELNGFITMLQNSVTNAMNINIDNLTMRTINSMTASVINGGKPLQKVNLLAGYNKLAGTTLTADKALTTPDFIKYANFVINTYKGRLAKLSTLFNVGAKQRFTPASDQHLVLLSDFASAGKSYLEADTIHNENVALNNYEEVAYWQATGANYDFNSVSSIDVAVKDNATTKEVKQGGILGILFDSDALGVACSNQRTTTSTNARAEFYTNYAKFDAMYFNDLDQNFVVFYIEDVKA